MNNSSRTILLALFFIASLASCHVLAGVPEMVYYVSLQGDDENPSTPERPFATPERAVRAAAESGGASVITLRQGYYPLKRSIELHDIDSLTMRSYPGERAHLIGGRQINGFEALKPGMPNVARIAPAVREHIFAVDLKKQGIAEFGALSARGFGRAIQPSGLELYFNGEPMTLARWPDSGWAIIADAPDSLHGEGFIYSGDRPSRWAHARDVWLHGYWKWDHSHPSDIIPTALAAGEKAIHNTRDLMVGIIIAYKLEMRWYLAAAPGICEVG